MQEKATFISSVIKGVLTALIITLVGVLIFGFILKITGLSSIVIKSVNQFIKVISIFLSCSFCVRGQFGLVKGGIIGVISSVLTLLLFSLFGVGENVMQNFFVELIFALVVGALSGIIAVNVKKRQ